MRTFLQVIGFLCIMAALLLLPALGYGEPSVTGFALGLVGWVLWWWLIRLIYRKTERQQPRP